MKDINITIRINQDTKKRLEKLKNLIENDVDVILCGDVTLSSIIRVAITEYLNKELYYYKVQKKN